MKPFIYLAISGALFAAMPALAASCLIHDPAGLPINVRSSPDGSVLGNLKNGTRVQSDLSRVGSWVYISWDKPALNSSYSGWIYRSFLRCG
ncbi:MAG: SH3 domain-containing protein [Neisseria sp.]|uniref:SH3 domain-containing protein n=1 Tax=Neisseria sp. TaxID=192066 RepID=UPI0026DDB1D1|nr:SH3 domain-containing protein [Neisseria sp.]MDO4641668.1 SH3 domain-containing protein [Neisseria sp.]